MKNCLMFLAIVFIFGAANIFATSKEYYPSGDACIAALENGTAVFYTPSFRNLFKEVSTSAGEEKVKLEDDACMLMVTRDGWQWVAQKKGTWVVMKGQAVLRRYDCGNPVKQTLYVGKPEVPIEPTKPVEPVKKKECPPGTTPAEGGEVCIQVVKEPVPGPTQTQYVDKPFSVCPAGFAFKGKTRLNDRLFGGLPQAGIGVAISAGLTAARKGKKEDYIESIVGSLLLQRTQQAFNASQSAVYLTGPGIDPILIKRGKDTPVGTGMEVVWAGNVAALVATYNNQEYTCTAYNLKTASNMGVWTSRTRMQDVIKNIPTKTQTPNQIPTIPGNGNQIPTGPNIPPGFPQVPCRRGANGQCLPPITSTPNTPTTGTNPTPQPTPTIPNPGQTPPINPGPPRVCRPGQPCIQFAPTTTGNTSATNNRQSTELVKPMVTTKAMSNRIKID